MSPDCRTVKIGEITTNVFIAGNGPPLTILPRDMGRNWGALHEDLSQSHCVIAPALPGYDGATLPEWLRSVTDLAALTGVLLDTVGAAPGAIVGLGFGGWLAAELAAHSPQRVTSMVLHSPMGIKPNEGEILDLFLFATYDCIRKGFVNETTFDRLFPNPDDTHFELWELNRQTTTRIAWKPYMHDPALPYLLESIKVSAHVLWSDQDRIVPRSCCEQYRAALSNCTFDVLAGEGHLVDLENPLVLSREIKRLLSS